MKALVTKAEYEAYGALPIDNDALCERLLKRATRDIVLLVGGELDFDSLSDKNKAYVKDAICAQVEFLLENGETASSLSGAGGSFSIGSYSESDSGRYASTSATKKSRYADTVWQHLYRTGLLFAGGIYEG
ncbi:hypothetical protein ACQRBK_07235 [Peptoniphilaceae bacterium SGI.137]